MPLIQSKKFKTDVGETTDMQDLQNTIKKHTDLEFTFDNNVCATVQLKIKNMLALKVSSNYFLFSWYPDTYNKHMIKHNNETVIGNSFT